MGQRVEGLRLVWARGRLGGLVLLRIVLGSSWRGERKVWPRSYVLLEVVLMLLLVLPSLVVAPTYPSLLISSSFRKSISVLLTPDWEYLSTLTEEDMNSSATHSKKYTTKRMKQLYLHSAEALALKWSTDILQQLSRSHPAAVAQHEQCIVTLLQLLQHMSQQLPLEYWTVGSLPDCCLLVIFNLAPTERTLLRHISAQRYLKYLVDDGHHNDDGRSSRNIHEMRASWIQCSLEVES